MTKPNINKKPAKRERIEPLAGKDEMNLSEFPLTKMGTRDHREVLEYSGWASDKRLGRYQQKWTVRSASGLGLPNEFGDRALLALLALTFNQSPLVAKVTFSRYQLLKLMGIANIGQKEYQHLEKVLLQLAGVTIVSERAFFDQTSERRPVFKRAFPIFADLWIRTDRSEEPAVAGEGGAEESSNGFIVWSPVFWKNLQGGYIKSIDLGFYNSLPTPLARRLYRLLDKRLHHRTTCEMDIFELSSRLGQPRYDRPSEVFRKLKPSIDAIIAERYLKSAELVKYGIYTRVRFERWAAEEFERSQARQSTQQQQIEKVKAHLKVEDLQQVALAEAWKQVISKAKAQLTGTVHALLAETVLVSLEGGRAVVVAQSRFAAEHLAAQRDLLTILATLLEQGVGESVTKIEFIDVQSATGTLKTKE